MKVINQVTLVGRLTKDPEARKTPEGVSYNYKCHKL
jgi:single-stranded DNA-binding protein